MGEDVLLRGVLFKMFGYYPFSVVNTLWLLIFELDPVHTQPSHFFT